MSLLSRRFTPWRQRWRGRRLRWHLAHDARYALRVLRRSPGFTAVAILTLAIGIGVNTAIFSVINAVVLQPLPYKDPGQLVFIDSTPVTQAPDWLTTAWRERARTLGGLAGYSGPRAATLVDGDEPRQIATANVTWNFLAFLGAAPVIGRDFTEADADQRAAVGIVSHDLWQNAFGRDPAILGRTLTVTGVPLTIVGVAPRGFRFPAGSALSTAGTPTPTEADVLRVADRAAPVVALARLAPGSTAASASQELLAIFRQEAGSRFRREAVERWAIQAVPLQDRLVGSVRRRLWLVMGAVAFVLLVACSNVASLLLARAAARQRELALRLALGARAGRIASLVLTESVVLALIAAAAAVLFASMTGGIARTLLADRVAHVEAIRIDGRVLAFAIGVAVATGLLCGLVALSGVRRLNLTAVVGSGTPAVTSRTLTRRVLLAAETAVTFVLVVGAALFLQTLWNLTTRERGFDADRLLTVRVAPGALPERDRSDRRARPAFLASFFGDLQQRLERIPGVASAAAVSLGPLEGTSAGFGQIAIDGRTRADDGSIVPVAFVTPGYLRTMRIAVVAGRDFTDGDRLGGDLVAIVNQTFRRRFAPGAGIVGARVTSGSGPESFTIVGVSQDVPDHSLRQSPQPLLMAPLAQMPGVHISWSALTFVLRTADGDPLRLAPDIRRTVWAVSPNIVINGMTTMDARVAVAMRTERDSALLFGLFAAAALVLAAIGVYGVAAYAIVQRTKEIGIRVALGAASRDVRRLVVAQTLWPTLAGIAAGAAAAALLTRLVASLVYGVRPLDPATFAAGVIVLLGVALAATWIPSRRAVRIDPLVALRHE